MKYYVLVAAVLFGQMASATCRDVEPLPTGSRLEHMRDTKIYTSNFGNPYFKNPGLNCKTVATTPPPAALTAKEELKNMNAGKSPQVRFAFDSAEISSQWTSELTALAERLKADPSSQVDVVGQTDSSGSERYNLRLGQSRAEAVKDFLINRGVPQNQINAVSKGVAFDAASDEEARRAQVLVK